MNGFYDNLILPLLNYSCDLDLFFVSISQIPCWFHPFGFTFYLFLPSFILKCSFYNFNPITALD